METNELRRGNFVCSNGVTVIVDGIQPSWLWSTDNSSTSIHEFKPIPLTEEWLLKFGFENKSHYAVGVGSYNTWCFGKLQLLRNIDAVFYFPVLPFSTVLLYVHQLQNLYFALTGDELTTTPNSY